MWGGALAAMSSCVLRLTVGDAMFYDVSLHTEARAENRVSNEGVFKAAEADPRLGLTWMHRLLVMDVAYSPQLLLEDPAGNLEVLHRASVAGTWGVQGNWRVLVGAEGSYGRNDFFLSSFAAPAAGSGAQQPQQPQQPLQSLPQVTTLQYESAQVSLGTEGRLGARSRGLVRASAFVEGGADALARTYLPFQRGVRLGGEMDWTASASDTLGSALSVQLSKFGDDTVDGTGALAATWRHSFNPDAQARLALGPAVTAHRPPHASAAAWAFQPSAEAGFRDRWLRTLEGDLSLRMSAVIDRVTGSIDQRADTTATLSWRPSAAWVLSATGSGGVVIEGGRRGEKVAAAQLRAGWTATPHWDFAVGARGLLDGGGPAPEMVEAGVFLSVTVHDRDRL